MSERTREPTNDLWEALSTQRAIRWFKPGPVPEDAIWKVIEAATRAPSGSREPQEEPATSRKSMGIGA